MADACLSPFGELFVGGLSQAINNGRKTTTITGNKCFQGQGGAKSGAAVGWGALG